MVMPAFQEGIFVCPRFIHVLDLSRYFCPDFLLYFFKLYGW
jgi:hypothetical protein